MKSRQETSKLLSEIIPLYNAIIASCKDLAFTEVISVPYTKTQHSQAARTSKWDGLAGYVEPYRSTLSVVLVKGNPDFTSIVTLHLLP